MKIPNKIKVAGLDYSVKIDDNMHQKEDLAGQHDGNALVIRLQNKNYNPQVTEQTFFHEILHAINTAYCNKELNEKQVNNISVGLYQVLKDNNLLL